MNTKTELPNLGEKPKPGLPRASSGPPSLPLLLAIVFLQALSALAPFAAAQPVITSFAADSPNIKP